MIRSANSIAISIIIAGLAGGDFARGHTMDSRN